jgi:hypothetical protein
MGYMEKYYRQLGLSVYWGTAKEFCGELRVRWEQWKTRV